MLEQLDLDADQGPHRAGSERLCAVTRQVRPTADMIRFVAAPDGEVVPDLKRKLPGRGVWMFATRETVEIAVKRGIFRHALRTEVRVSPDLAARVEERLLQSALDALSIAHKAGVIVLGFAKVEAAAIRSAEVVALVHSAEASEDGRQKIARAAESYQGCRRGQIARVRTFTTAQLDLALGRANVVHAALLAGPASETFLTRWRNLERYRTSVPERVAVGLDTITQTVGSTGNLNG